jgi:hypothetical protein
MGAPAGGGGGGGGGGTPRAEAAAGAGPDSGAATPTVTTCAAHVGSDGACGGSISAVPLSAGKLQRQGAVAYLPPASIARADTSPLPLPLGFYLDPESAAGVQRAPRAVPGAPSVGTQTPAPTQQPRIAEPRIAVAPDWLVPVWQEEAFQEQAFQYTPPPK